MLQSTVEVRGSESFTLISPGGGLASLHELLFCNWLTPSPEAKPPLRLASNLLPFGNRSSTCRSCWAQVANSALVSQPRPPHSLRVDWMRPACVARQREAGWGKGAEGVREDAWMPGDGDRNAPISVREFRERPGPLRASAGASGSRWPRWPRWPTGWSRSGISAEDVRKITAQISIRRTGCGQHRRPCPQWRPQFLRLLFPVPRRNQSVLDGEDVRAGQRSRDDPLLKVPIPIGAAIHLLQLPHAILPIPDTSCSTAGSRAVHVRAPLHELADGVARLHLLAITNEIVVPRSHGGAQPIHELLMLTALVVACAPRIGDEDPAIRNLEALQSLRARRGKRRRRRCPGQSRRVVAQVAFEIVGSEQRVWAVAPGSFARQRRQRRSRASGTSTATRAAESGGRVRTCSRVSAASRPSKG